MTKRWRMLFHLGLAAPAALLGVAAAGVAIPQARLLLNDVTLLIYLGIGVGHVTLLGSVASALPADQRAAAPAWLYAAGFVHTLLACGVAIATAGYSLADGDGLSAAALGVVLIPLSGAILPHAVGVWIGQTLESPTQADVAPGTGLDGDLFVDMADRLDAVFAAVHDKVEAVLDLWARRESLLRDGNAAIDDGNTALQQQAALLGSLSTALNDVVAQVQSMTDLIQEPARELRDAFRALTPNVSAVKEAVGDLQEAVAASAAEARGIQPGIRAATDVIGDLTELQRSIVDLLASEIFRRQGDRYRHGARTATGTGRRQATSGGGPRP